MLMVIEVLAVFFDAAAAVMWVFFIMTPASATLPVDLAFIDGVGH